MLTDDPIEPRKLFCAVADHLAARITKELLLCGGEAAYIELWDSNHEHLGDMQRKDIEETIANELYEWLLGDAA
jgi:hypothetical protein